MTKNSKKCPLHFNQAQSDVFRFLVLSNNSPQPQDIYFVFYNWLHSWFNSTKPAQCWAWQLILFINICVPHLVGPLHGDGEVVLSSRVPALADEHLVADTTRLSSLLGVQLSTNHLGRNVSGLLWPGRPRGRGMNQKWREDCQREGDTMLIAFLSYILNEIWDNHINKITWKE